MASPVLEMVSEQINGYFTSTKFGIHSRRSMTREEAEQTLKAVLSLVHNDLGVSHAKNHNPRVWFCNKTNRHYIKVALPHETHKDYDTYGWKMGYLIAFLTGLTTTRPDLYKYKISNRDFYANPKGLVGKVAVIVASGDAYITFFGSDAESHCFDSEPKRPRSVDVACNAEEKKEGDGMPPAPNKVNFPHLSTGKAMFSLPKNASGAVGAASVTPRWGDDEDNTVLPPKPKSKVFVVDKTLVKENQKINTQLDEARKKLYELKMTNEELEKTNEELKMTNEELEKTNEELEKANAKLNELNEANAKLNEELELKANMYDMLQRLQRLQRPAM